jgi:hypothetical protein
MLASQLETTIRAERGGLIGAPGVGEMLIERVLGPGNSLRWDRLIEEATGRPLSPEDLAAELTEG